MTSGAVPTGSDRPRPIGVLDLPWLALDTRRHPMHVAGLIIFAAPDGAGPHFVRSTMAAMMRAGVVTDPFGWRVSRRGWGKLWPTWQPTERIDLEQHVRLRVLPDPGGEAELSAMVSDLHRTQLVRGRPLWEMTFIDGLEGNRFAIYAKFHHSLVDGVGAIRIIQSAFSPDPGRRDLPAIWAFTADRRNARRKRRSRLAVLAGLPRTLAAAARATRADGRVLPYSAPASPLNQAVSSERRVVLASWPADELRAVAQQLPGTVNEALLSICASGLRRYLLETDALPNQPLVAAIPMSVRPIDADDFGNAISFGFVSLATDVDDVTSRGARIVESSLAAKAHLARLPKRVIDAYTVLTMGPFILSQLVGLGARLRPMFSVAISNLPGPTVPMYFNGIPVLGIHPVSLLQSGQALNITALSYAGRVNVTFTACAEALPDVHRLAACCTEALESHAHAAVAGMNSA